MKGREKIMAYGDTLAAAGGGLIITCKIWPTKNPIKRGDMVWLRGNYEITNAPSVNEPLACCDFAFGQALRDEGEQFIDAMPIQVSGLLRACPKYPGSDYSVMDMYEWGGRIVAVYEDTVDILKCSA